MLCGWAAVRLQQLARAWRLALSVLTRRQVEGGGVHSAACMALNCSLPKAASMYSLTWWQGQPNTRLWPCTLQAAAQCNRALCSNTHLRVPCHDRLEAARCCIIAIHDALLRRRAGLPTGASMERLQLHTGPVEER